MPKNKKRGHPSNYQKLPEISGNYRHSQIPREFVKIPDIIVKKPGHYCKNCRQLLDPVITPPTYQWELATGSCIFCLNKADRAVREFWYWELAYSREYASSGYDLGIDKKKVWLVPMRSTLRYEFLRRLLRIPILRGFVRALVKWSGFFLLEPIPTQ